MMLAKPAGMKPRELAEKLIAALPQDAQISKVEIAGPGFLNFFQNSDALAQRLETALADAQLAVHKASAKRRVVIDLSSPNLAKEMHVGHLRSTIIGDAVGRVLEFLGDEVIRQNHVGDWGSSACCWPTSRRSRPPRKASWPTSSSSTAPPSNASTSRPSSPIAPVSWWSSCRRVMPSA